MNKIRTAVALTVSLVALVALPSAHAATHRKHRATVAAVAAHAPITISTVEGYASQIAGSPVTIACDSPDTEGGHVQFDGVIHLDPWVCTALTKLNDTSTVAYSMLALQHEATHILLNSADEGLVECTAITNRYQLVHLFKLPYRMAIQVMADELAIHESIIMPGAYRAVC